MATPVARTLIVPTTPIGGYGATPSLALQWPTAEPGDVLDYYLDVTAPLADLSDTILTASAAVAPSGAGEMTISSMSITGTVIGVWLAGGIAGRSYLIRVLATTTGGRTLEWIVRLKVDAFLAAYPLPAPPSLGFGASATCSAATPISISLARPLSASLIAAL